MKKDRPCDGCPILRTFQDGKVHRSERALVLNGSLRTIEITASPVRDSGGHHCRHRTGARRNGKKTPSGRVRKVARSSNQSDCWQAVLPTTSTTCSPPFTATSATSPKLSIGDSHEALRSAGGRRAALRATGVTRQLLTFSAGGAPAQTSSIVRSRQGIHRFYALPAPR